MSKINAVRFINLSYNNNAIRISDEIFQLNGESTLLSLRNGGGKSVLVQMMMAPFIHRRYRDAKDRPFESYFTTGKPTFILVEWLLDQGAGYVLTGMMVRRSQEVSENPGEDLEIISIISEYKERCQQDIYHLPVIEKMKKEVVLKNFGACKQLFETFKKERKSKFTYYDMSNSAQSRQYFEKLKEYQINYKEWETIIKKVNLKESGLSELFADCKDEKGLVEKWFLDAVESKLNKERNRMKEFQTIVEKYVGQYKDNKSKIERRDTIRLFKEEAAGILERAENYQEATNREKDMENQIANFLKVMEELENNAREEKNALEEQCYTLKEQISYIEYEKLSQEIHTLLEKERYHTSNREMIGMERDDLEQESDRILHTLHLYDCARQQEAVDEYQMDHLRAKQRLTASRQGAEELEPERQRLGARLKSHFVGSIRQKQEEEQRKQAAIQETLEQIKGQKEKIEELQEWLMESTNQAGVVKAGLQGYDKKEDNFNHRYHEDLNRNILGEYEPGELDIRMQKYESRLASLLRDKRNDRKQLEQSGEKKKSEQRSYEDMKEESIRAFGEQKEIERALDQMEEELKERRIIMRYLGVEEKALFENDTILSVAERKLGEIELVKRRLEKEEDALQKEHTQLTQGKVLELPEEFEELLKELGLTFVFGMEWLRRNGRTSKENQDLIHRIPFLPYGLILSRQELTKLSAYGKEVYTSFPIPIIIRESLEKAAVSREGNIIDFPEVSFYVFFNKNLLDEEKLALLVKEKEEQLQKKQNTIAIKKAEYEDYFEKKERIKNQKITGKGYEETKEKLLRIGEELEKLDTAIRKKAEELTELTDWILLLEEKIRKTEKEIGEQNRCLEDYRELYNSYEVYLEQCRQLERLEKHMQRMGEQRKLTQELLEKREENWRTLESEHDSILREQNVLKEKYHVYAGYADYTEFPENTEDIRNIEAEAGGVEDIPALEARYQAITSGLSATLKELEAQIQDTGKRLDKVKNDLAERCRKYHLESDEWKQVTYNKKEELHQESLLEDRNRKKAVKERAWNEEDKNAAIVTQQIKERKETMWKRHEKEEPIPKSEIRTIDFAAKMNELNYQKNEIEKLQTQCEKRLHSYGDNLTALAEYAHFPVVSIVTWEKNFPGMNQKELRDFKGMLVRDYKAETQEKWNLKNRLEQLLNQIVRKEALQEDFYRKPLESILELTYDAAQVINQLSITIQSYNRLMEKLEVDISMVEKEKQKIVEILGDYLEEVHLNLGKIDVNSTITIRERPIKMLKIQLPVWEENENLYQVRLQDFMDKLTEKGIEIYEKNENAQEYFGTKVTTRNLYDTVIGIGNVQIRLYKIEEQREYPITWTEVAKNSGGEGFLSAFVILSSLLYYMRKDDSDFFANRNEGKVLVMDNPFAQTNAAHLLKPLMEMAQKTNTQLICLTGLGGESIYNRFDNIYVLNLIAAGLRNGMQYLKAERLRGREEETIVVSQIEVLEQEQMTLF